MACRYCNTVNTLCFWEPLPARSWKRPALLILFLLLGGGFSASLVLTWSDGVHPLIVALVVAFVAVCLLGLLVALGGCDTCVARLLGNAA